MPGTPLGIGETNPKRGAIQWDARRIDGVKFIIPSTASISAAPIGSVVTLQENSSGKQVIVLGAAPVTISSEVYAIIAVGFLEAASQANSSIDQTIAQYSDGDFVSMISDVNAVSMSPYDADNKPSAGDGVYVNADGELSSDNGGVLFIGSVWYGTPGIQNSGQLKSGYAFARLASVMI